MPAYEEPEEQWRTDLRPIGLTVRLLHINIAKLQLTWQFL